MRRQSDEFSRSQLADVDEECETDLVPERFSRSSISPEMNSSSKPPRPDRKSSSGSMGSELYWEATGRRRSSDQGIVLTTDTDSFIIGQRVWVGGARPGHIAYIGETHFAPGEWAGIVLDEPNGKNDGCVSGKRYFQCEQKRGIFSRLTRLTHEPIPGALLGDISPFETSQRSLTSPSRSTNVSPPGSVRSVTPKTLKSSMTVGDRVIVSSGLGSRAGLLQFIGETKFAPGTWCGVQLDEPSGKNDGSVDGVKYFECPSKCGIFVPVAKVTLSPSSRKSRLSRAGSRESLTSVGTINSVASTATSRLRMSAQRHSSSAKPLTTPKATFSLQDVLREKQNHIEQLIVEKDLDRQDSENQALMYQKDISQLKERINHLEHKLNDEKQKAEDLQFSIDEVTFCGEELNAQTQVYKEKIENLEKQILEGSTVSSNHTQQDEIDHIKGIERLKTELSGKDSQIQQNEILRKSLENEMIVLREKLIETETSLDIKVNSTNISDQCLQEEISYLNIQIDDLKNELNGRNEAIEKQYLSMREIETALKEEITSLQNQLKTRDEKLLKSETGTHNLIKDKEKIILELEEKITNLSQTTASKDDEIKRLQTITIEIEKQKTNEINIFKTDIENLIKDRDEKDVLVVKCQGELNQISQLAQEQKSSLADKESITANLEGQRIELEKVNNEFQGKIQKNEKLIKELKEVVIKDKDNKIVQLGTEINKLHEQIQEIKTNRLNLETALSTKDKELEENEVLISALQGELKEINSSKTGLEKELDNFKNNIQDKDGAFKKLNDDFNKLNKKLVARESAYQTLEAELIHRNEENENLNKKILELELTLEKLQKSFDVEMETVKITLEQKKIEIGTIQIVNETIAQKLQNELVLLKKEVEELRKENEGQKTLLNQKEAAIKTLENGVDVRSTEVKELTGKTSNLENEIKDKLTQIEKLNKNLSDLTGKLEGRDGEFILLQEKNSKLELEHGDLGRKMAALEQKSVQILEQKESLEMALEGLKNTSFDKNTEVSRLSEELKSKQKAFEELLDGSNSIKIDLEKQIQEITQNFTTKTQQCDSLKNEIEELMSQKVDRENELNIELARFKEMAEGEKEILLMESETLRKTFKEEKEKLINDINEQLSHNTNLNLQMNESISRLEQSLKEMKQEADLSQQKFKLEEENLNKIILELRSAEKILKVDLEASKSNEESLKNSLNDVTKSSEKGNSELFIQINEKNSAISNFEKELGDTKGKLNEKSQELKELHLIVKKTEEESEIRVAEFEKKNKEIEIQVQQIIEQKNILEMSLNEMKEKYESTAIKLKEMEDEQVDLVNKNEESLETINKFEENWGKLEIEKQMIEVTLVTKQTEFDEFKKSSETMFDEFNKKLQITNDEITTKNLTIQRLEENLNHLTSSVNLSDDLKNELKSKSDELKTKNDNIIKLQENILALENNVKEKDLTLAKILDEKDNETKSLTDDNSKKSETINEIQLKLQETEKNLTEKNGDIAKLIFEKMNESKNYLDEKEKLSLEIILCKKMNVEFEEKLNEKNEKIIQLENRILVQTNENKLLNESGTESVKCMQEVIKKKDEENQKEIDELIMKMDDLENKLKIAEKNAGRIKDLENRETELLCQNKKIEVNEMELTNVTKKLQREIQSLQLSLNQKDLELKMAKERKIDTNSTFENDTGAQISFLNSIIADMQKKNETLISKLQLLESGSGDNALNGINFQMPGRRMPAPRVFCDMCDEWDSHETEDCPRQCSDPIPPPRDSTKERVLPPNRTYCESCGVFGHELGECDDDETF